MMTLATHPAPVTRPTAAPIMSIGAVRQEISPDVGPVDWALSCTLYAGTTDVAGPVICTLSITGNGGLAPMPSIDAFRHRDPGERPPVYFH